MEKKLQIVCQHFFVLFLSPHDLSRHWWCGLAWTFHIKNKDHPSNRESEVTVHLTESGFISFCVLFEFVAPETSFENHLRSASAMSITMFCC